MSGLAVAARRLPGALETYGILILLPAAILMEGTVASALRPRPAMDLALFAAFAGGATAILGWAGRRH